MVSISTAVNWFQDQHQPHPCISDIHLADGSSFEIFKQVKIECPIIFITAMPVSAYKAFKHTVFIILLKPIKKEDFT